VGPFKNVNPVLLHTPLERGHMINQSICKKPVSEEGVVGPLYQKTIAVVVDIVNRFGIIRVFFNPIPNVAVNHIIEYPKNIPEDGIRFLGGKFQEFIKGEGGAVFLFLYLIAQGRQCIIDGIPWHNLIHSSVLVSFLFSMV
jgi:hypothetical protein